MVVLRDKIAGICPLELEAARQNAMQLRLARLGFELLQRAQANEARAPLREARHLGPRRLDVTVATAVSSLPLPEAYRAGLWQTTLALSRGMKRFRTAVE
jgi:hypothetical protein